MCYLLSVLAVVVIITACSEDKTGQSETTQNNSKKQEETTKPEDESTNDQGDTEIKSKSNNKEEDILGNVPLVPTDEAGFAAQKSGKFADKVIWDVEKEVKKELEKLTPMSKNPTEQEYKKYLSYMYWLVAEDFPNPEDVVKKWEFASFGNPDLPDARYHFKENYNVEIILDASGSMAAKVDGQTRMELAKETINNFLKNIPEKANVSLRVYGHKGSGSESDKEMSCSAIEQIDRKSVV